MRIAIWHHLPSGGGLRALHDQVRGLAARGHQLEMWFPENAERTFMPVETLAPVHFTRPLVQESRRKGDGTLGGSWRRFQAVHRDLSTLNRYMQTLAHDIDQSHPDVILAHPSSMFYMHPLARFTSTPCVLYLQEVYRQLYEAQPALPWEALHSARSGRGGFAHAIRSAANALDVQAARLLVREERESARAWDLLLCNSFFSRESIVRVYGIDARVCYLGVDVQSFAVGDGEKRHFLGVGAVHPLKAVHLAIQAVGLLPATRRLPLRWVGNFADKRYALRCEELARELGVDFVVDLRVPESALRQYFQQALALVYPAVLEPFGYAALEANACGVPVVAIAEGGLRETVRDGVNGLLADDRCPETLAAALDRLVTDPKLRSDLGRQGRAWVENHWNLEQAIARLEQELVLVHRAGRRRSSSSNVHALE